MKAESELLQNLMLLARVTQIVLQDEVLKDVPDGELSQVRLSILRLLRRRERQSVNDLARFLGLTKAAASQNVERLVRVGLVERREDPNDRRGVWVTLTARGQRILEEVEKEQRRVLEKAMHGFEAGSLRHLSAAMRSLALSLLNQNGEEITGCLQCCAYDSPGCVCDGEDWACQYMSSRPQPASAGAADPA